MSVVGITHNLAIKAHYLRKHEQGKSNMNAIGHCMRKSLDRLGIWHGDHDFQPEPPPKA